MTRASDPGRLSEVTPQSPLGQLLASAERDVPSDREIAKLAGRLGEVLEPALVPAAAAPSSSLLAKVGLVIGVAALVVGGLLSSRRPHAGSPAQAQVSGSAAPPASVISLSSDGGAPTALAPPSSAAAAIAESAPEPALLRKSSSEPLKSAASGSEGPSEPVLLEQARRSLTSSPATALALTNQHAARFPHGVLAQEREVIAIEALRRLGRSAEADRRAAAFAQAFPGSAHQRMVEDASPK